MTNRVPLLVALGLCATLACSRSKETSKAGANATGIEALRTAGPPSAKHVCRAQAVTGHSTVDGGPVYEGFWLDGEHWVELAEGATIALRHRETSREFQLIGPGRVLPCRKSAEMVLLSSGRITTSAGLGVRPGAEVLIATPAGSVRYGDAALSAAYGSSGLTVQVKEGEAWVEPEADGSPRFTNPVRSGAEAHLAAPAVTSDARVATCQTSAEAAAASAARVVAADPGAGGASTLGERAAVQMRDRSKARVDCAIAAAAIASLDNLEQRLSLSTSLASSEKLWQGVPRFSNGRKN